MNGKSIATAAYLLAGWSAASLSCSDDADQTPPQNDAVVVPRVDAGAVTSSTGGSGGAPAPGDAAVRADAASARVDASVDASTADAGAWWEGASWTPLSWSHGDCTISVLDDPSRIPPLEWEPFVLGDLTGETPVVPLGHRYREMDDGTNWVRGSPITGEDVVAVRDGAGAVLFGFKLQSCLGVGLASTSRGVCAQFQPYNLDPGGVPGALACGDLHDPDPLLEIPRSGGLVASSDELVMILEWGDQGMFFVDLSDDSITKTSAAGQGFVDATAHGRDAFTLYDIISDPATRRGIIFHWDGATGYEMVWDPQLPLGVVNVHAADGLLVWTEAEVDSPTAGTSIYRAPWPPSGATIEPTLVRKIETVTDRGRTTLGAGQIAFGMTDRIELIDLDDAARHTVSMTDRWQVTGGVSINDRSLVVRIFEKAKVEPGVTFRAKLSDVLALPAD